MRICFLRRARLFAFLSRIRDRCTARMCDGALRHPMSGYRHRSTRVGHGRWSISMSCVLECRARSLRCTCTTRKRVTGALWGWTVKMSCRWRRPPRKPHDVRPRSQSWAMAESSSRRSKACMCHARCRRPALRTVIERLCVADCTRRNLRCLRRRRRPWSRTSVGGCCSTWPKARMCRSCGRRRLCRESRRAELVSAADGWWMPTPMGGLNDKDLRATKPAGRPGGASTCVEQGVLGLELRESLANVPCLEGWLDAG